MHSSYPFDWNWSEAAKCLLLLLLFLALEAMAAQWHNRHSSNWRRRASHRNQSRKLRQCANSSNRLQVDSQPSAKSNWTRLAPSYRCSFSTHGSASKPSIRCWSLGKCRKHTQPCTYDTLNWAKVWHSLEEHDGGSSPSININNKKLRERVKSTIMMQFFAQICQKFSKKKPKLVTLYAKFFAKDFRETRRDILQIRKYKRASAHSS